MGIKSYSGLSEQTTDIGAFIQQKSINAYHVQDNALIQWREWSSQVSFYFH